MFCFGQTREQPFCYGSVCHSMFYINKEGNEAVLIIKENGNPVINLYITKPEFDKIRNSSDNEHISCASESDLEYNYRLFYLSRREELELIWKDTEGLSRNLERWSICGSIKNPWYSIILCKQGFINHIGKLFAS